MPPTRLPNLKVSNVWLLLTAGLVWSGVSLMLFSLAYRWLEDLHSSWSIWIVVCGLAASLIVYRFGFYHLTQKNIARLKGFLEKASPLAFFSGRSYLVMIFMMALGMGLRSSIMPRSILAFIYTTIGGGMFFSSLHYYPQVFELLKAAG